jgi:HSP20 family molecular chaperone IbpA
MCASAGFTGRARVFRIWFGAIRIGNRLIVVESATGLLPLFIVLLHLAVGSALINAARSRASYDDLISLASPRAGAKMMVRQDAKYGSWRSLRSQEGALTTRMFTSPLFLGFDHLEQMLERASKTSSDGYPPYNIEQISPTGLRISLAVAGFTMDDLQITQEDNQLVIRGRQTDDSQGRIFLHRGIAARQFQRSFVLAEGIDVKGAWLDNGLLHIDLAKPQPEVRVKTIPITRNTAAAALRPVGAELGAVVESKAE